MGAMAVTMPGSVGGFTVDDLDAFPPDGRRYELVDGVLFVSPAPVPGHQIAVLELASLLRAAAPSGHLVMVAPVEVRRGSRTSLQPDVMVFARHQVSLHRHPVGPPLLAVEVLSPSTRDVDLGLKRLTYARLGVPCYWLVDPTEPSIQCLELGPDGYREVAAGRDADPVTVGQPFPVTVVPRELLAGFDQDAKTS